MADMKRVYVTLVVFISTILSVLFLFDIISLQKLLGIEAFWIILYYILAIGPETVSRISTGVLSIERDVQAAKSIRDHIEIIRTELKDITKISAENTYILGQSSLLAMGGDKQARQRLENNLDALSKIVETNKEKEDAWWDELEALFPGRVKND